MINGKMFRTDASCEDSAYRDNSCIGISLVICFLSVINLVHFSMSYVGNHMGLTLYFCAYASLLCNLAAAPGCWQFLRKYFYATMFCFVRNGLWALSVINLFPHSKSWQLSQWLLYKSADKTMCFAARLLQRKPYTHTRSSAEILWKWEFMHGRTIGLYRTSLLTL
jgi:hypothetical protein